MVLEVDDVSKALRLVIYNRKYLWVNNNSYVGAQCFAFLEYGTLKKANLDLVWENQEQSYSILNVNLFSSYRTEYWCEGHSIFEFQLVSTRLLVDYNRNTAHGFVIRWNVSCINANFAFNLCDEVTGKHLRNLSESIYGNSDLGHLFIHDVRIMNMEWIKNIYVVFWIHILAALKITAEYDVHELAFGDNAPKITKNSFAFMQIKITLNIFFFSFIKNSTYLIRSKDYCSSERLFSNDGLQWTTTRIGEIATTKKLCIQKNGMPYTRLCLGDFVHGAYWKELTKPVVCESPKYNTKVLYNLIKAKIVKSLPEKALQNVKNIIANSKNSIVPADIFFISKIIQSVLKTYSSNLTLRQTNEESTKWKNAFSDIFDIYNILIDIDSNVIKKSSELNATKKLLRSFERYVDTLSTNLPFTKIGNGEEQLVSELQSETIDYDDIGVSVYISKYILYFSINPSIANVSGIALFANNKKRNKQKKLKGAFKNEHYRFLQVNHDINDVVDEPDLELGVYLPIDLIGTLKASTNKLNDVTVVIKVYSNDQLFQQSVRSLILLSRIVSISIPGYSSNLPVPVPIIFRKSQNKEANTSSSCEYWNYESWIDGKSMLNNFENSKGKALCLLRRLAPTGYFLEKNNFIENTLIINNSSLNENIIYAILLTSCLLMFIGFWFCK
ncbi:uncharacterized protein LOC120457499 [Drosophila santomea]|uniref:uncharacterized protein LOC120457499 n=1 Tax=Drosophila santomea TaxID=129105 RepID=UPI001953D6BC|nr:uncharacterized protein LOC120457499 [Drosophila santomea]